MFFLTSASALLIHTDFSQDVFTSTVKASLKFYLFCHPLHSALRAPCICCTYSNFNVTYEDMGRSISIYLTKFLDFSYHNLLWVTTAIFFFTILNKYNSLKFIYDKSMILKSYNYILYYSFEKVLEENLKEQSKIH